MQVSSQRILLTGLPGVGKTTVIRTISHGLGGLKPHGFYTAEIREQAVRKGFKLLDLSGESLVLAHVGIKSPYRIGKYGVDVAAFDEYLGRHDWLHSAIRLVIIDEIGKMECLSKKFTVLIRELLQSDKHLIATVALRGGGLMAEIKDRPDIRLITITPHNRTAIPADILRHFIP